MPETSIDEDGHLGASKHDVGASSKTGNWSNVNSIAHAELMKL